MDILRVFDLAQRAVDRLPEPVGRGLFNIVGSVSGVSSMGGARQLRKNQARLRPGMNWVQARLLSSRAMRSYMRYYYESLRLHSLSREQILARVSEAGTERVRAELAEGRSITGALTHAGNWDLAGAWSNIALAEVHTIAEKLDPPELYDGFLAFREGLGMTIYPLVKGGGALHKLARDMEAAPIFTPVLADRDLSHTGIEVVLAGHTVRVAPGPALLAQRTGVTIYPTFVHYERLSGERRKKAGSSWGIRVTILEGVRAATTLDSTAEERRQDLVRMSQEWMSALEPYLKAHLEDWHMLQKVFIDDLDPARLAASRAKAAEKVQHLDSEQEG
ncbi:phosphatidylinositol mannoside acyltransferase [Ancrocorticia populi]|uniref:Phosphatidylinositol mannoside acyltransferase n=1 Tax=Ancrocorticia populi TaxID=2175228 RepID=A0A2V1K6G7_9ACTO|nr:phosphatidylinositol mannoside acyltransferase [Ancrocorticia populi]PWF24582.1 phosphatidylinositol mannoside acyltransferase [Ancrocorticia populi]